MGSDCCMCNILCHPFTIAVISILAAFRIWFKWTTGVYRSDRQMTGKTVIITGANTGIGKETARDLASRGARVILACRDQKKGKQALDDIVSDTGNTAVVLHHLDLASLKSVREFAKTILETESRLDVLVNNAGAAGLGNKITTDGLHIGMQANHFGPFLLTNLLLGLLRKTAPSRIVMVSSMAHKGAKLDVDDLNCSKPIADLMVYNNTKLANILMANELAKKLKGTGVTVNSLHPGVVRTEVYRRLPVVLWFIVDGLARLMFKSVVEGAQTTIYLSVSSEVDGVTGKYFADCKEKRPSRAALDQELAKRLWHISEKSVKLLPAERHY